jgi:hypothetical protein
MTLAIFTSSLVYPKKINHLKNTAPLAARAVFVS